ncbi:MAG: ATP-binding protein [Proteobacteria bacterium]|nr:ATP-binding protein [Pseudomonadota bacterium]
MDEALQNIIRHAYNMDKDKKIKIEFDKDSKDNLRIRLRDYGIQTPIDKIKSRELDDIRPGGLGVHFIKSSTKEMSYEHQEDGGTLLTLVF